MELHYIKPDLLDRWHPGVGPSAAEVRAMLDEGVARDGTPLFLDSQMRPIEYLSGWFRQLSMRNRDAKTMRQYAYLTRSLVHFLEDRGIDVLWATEADLTAFRRSRSELQEVPVEDRTWDRDAGVIDRLYGWLCDNGHIERRPIRLDGNGRNPLAGESTVRRWVKEVVKLLAARSPRLDRALKKIARSGGVVVLLDGTLIRTHRRTGKDDRKNYSGKHKAHGLLFLALTDEKGNLIWISAAKPGRSSEITTARHNKITGHLREAGLGALADLGFVGLDDKPDDDPVIITGRKATRNHQLTAAEKETNRLVSRERAANEHGFANLKSWRILTKLRTDTRQATTLLRALLVLANSEVQR
ncbi:transposase family protein [Streptomyces sp. NBC_01538]|uniref:transposase family protein n=1 Tax=Streptomyces sp. NBC_01538 TaxID=2903897 RepID=UPI003863EB8D